MRTSTSLSLGLGLGLALLALGAPPASAQQERYGFYRIVEGSASVAQADGREALEPNQPLVPGDHLSTAGGRVEVVLPDGSLVRVGPGTELTFQRLGGGDDLDLLALDHGEVQIVATNAYDTRVDMEDATVYLREAGTYRIVADDGGSRLVVRDGSAELRTRRGARGVGPGEEAWVDGDYARIEVAEAGPGDNLERWAAQLDDEFRRARWDDDYVDSSLDYAAAPMASYGSWVAVGGRHCWRPRVAVDWSPYRNGRWGYTPAGLTWVSYEPWGWVPYHYGTWDYAPGFGWIWYPGATYAPAWVYWYWGPSQVGWCPIGYYSHYYGPRLYAGLDWDGFGFGIHGWAGGPVRFFDRWTFVDGHHFNDHRLAYYTRSGSQLGRELRELPRGVIATDTRAIHRGMATRGEEAMRALVNHTNDATEGFVKPIRRELPDISRFVARDPNLDTAIARVALPVATGHGQGQARGRWSEPGVGGGARPHGEGAVGAPAPRGGGDILIKPRTGENDGRWRGGENADGESGGAVSRGDRGREGAARDRSGSTDQGWRGGAATGGGSSTSTGGERPDRDRGEGGAQPRGGDRGVSTHGVTGPAGGQGTGASGGSGSASSSRSGSSSSEGSKPAATPKPQDRPERPQRERHEKPAQGEDGDRPHGASAYTRGYAAEGWRGTPGVGPAIGSPSVVIRRYADGAPAPRTVTVRGRDDSWRGGAIAGGEVRSPVRRVVEGMRSYRYEPPPAASGERYVVRPPAGVTYGAPYAAPRSVAVASPAGVRPERVTTAPASGGRPERVDTRERGGRGERGERGGERGAARSRGGDGRPHGRD